MNILQKALQRIEYGDYTPVAQYGQIYSGEFGQERFTLSAQLLRSKTDWALRLDLNRRWGSTGNRTVADCHFHTVQELGAPFLRAAQDVRSQAREGEVKTDLGWFGNLITGLAAGKIIRTYGRIDRHPRDDERLRLELYLSWDGQRHWLLLRETGEWTKWPAEIADTINRLLPELEKATQRHQ